MGQKINETFQANVIVKNLLWDRFLVSCEGVTFVVSSNLELSNKNIPVSYIPCEGHVNEDCESKGCVWNDDNLHPKYSIRDKMCKLNIKLGSASASKLHDIEKKRAYGSLRLFVNGYLLSLFVKTLQSSTYYRKSVISHFARCCRKRMQFPQSQLQVIIKLVNPRREIIDYAWNYRIEILVVETRELENAMSWLSTLGGAFSALGDQFERCAEIAGRISVQQLKIALRLGDPYTVARCKLYLALSLLQRSHLKPAKRIILEQYKLAKTPPILDHRLVRMCLGIWAKLKFEQLKFEHRRRTQQKRKKQKQQDLQRKINC